MQFLTVTVEIRACSHLHEDTINSAGVHKFKKSSLMFLATREYTSAGPGLSSEGGKLQPRSSFLAFEPTINRFSSSAMQNALFSYALTLYRCRL